MQNSFICLISMFLCLFLFSDVYQDMFELNVVHLHSYRCVLEECLFNYNLSHRSPGFLAHLVVLPVAVVVGVLAGAAVVGVLAVAVVVGVLPVAVVVGVLPVVAHLVVVLPVAAAVGVLAVAAVGWVRFVAYHCYHRNNI